MTQHTLPTDSQNIPQSLEDIAKKKAEVLAQIRNKRELMSNLGQNFVEPLKTGTTRINSLTGALKNGMVMFDIFIAGFKIFRRIRKSIRRF